ncbi:nuclear transport factor 2 family protein [uncultured Ellagibacter sp.]|uniref:nuclear transport factor 2 family protein n=1 Tax=uncultured Ellagibacter sp. TaxID=2137580 RepID=UPI0025D8A4E6|nr:nuclear transport factor 2 family protein [uncultured Ellagibacter sp.]
MTTLEELEKRIAAQEDLRAIERLQANYWDYLDAKNWEGLRSILVEDFVFINNTTGGRYEGREGMLSTMEGKFCDGVISSHQGHHHWVELVDETHAISHWSLEDDLYDSKHGGEFVGRAHYDNKYVKIDGRWYFEEMSLTYLRGKGEIKKLADDCANAYKVFMM